MSVVVGVVGILVPGLPTTVFFIIAAAAFARSNERLEQWVLGLPGIGGAVDDYRSGRGMPKRAKFSALVMLTTAVLASVILFIDPWWVRALVLLVGLIGAVFIVRVPTKTESR